MSKSPNSEPKKSSVLVPPYSEEAEIAVIGSVLLDPSSVLELLIERKITSKDFYVPKHQTIFIAMGEMHAKGRVIDVLTLSEFLAGKGELDRIGGTRYLDDLIDKTPTSVHAEYYIDIIKKKSMSRIILNLSQQIQGEAYACDEPEELRSKAEAAFTRLQQDQQKMTLRLGMETIIADLNRINDGGDPRPLGPSTGFAGLDAALGGGMGAGVNFITGEPGTGKTSLVCNIMLNLIAAKHRVAFVTLEMSIDDMLQKMISIICNKNIRHTLVGRAKVDMEMIKEAKKILLDSGMFDIADQSLIQDEVQFMSWCRRKVLRDKTDIIVLDYLQLLDVQDDKGMNDEQKVSKLAGVLQKAASMLDVSLLVIGEENSDGKIRYSRRADYSGATHWRLLKVGDAEPRGPDFAIEFDVFTNKARFGVKNSKTGMTLYGSTGRVVESKRNEDEYDYSQGIKDLPEASGDLGPDEDAGLNLFPDYDS